MGAAPADPSNMSNATNKRLVSGFLPLAMLMLGLAAVALGVGGAGATLVLIGGALSFTGAVVGAVHLRLRGREFETPEDPDFAGNPL